MGAGYLIDSNILIKYAVADNASANAFILTVLESGFQISVITRIEVLSKNSQLQEFISEATILPLLEEVIIKTIEIRQKHKIKLPDAIIAATAIVNNLKLLTHNTKDFNNIKELTIVDPFNL